MAPYYPPPSEETLLLPLLACLPIAFASPRPPPALLPILSPILRQRVKLLSEPTPGSSDGSWLPLLCWESEEASKLPGIVETVSFDPHPVSGEVEIGDADRTLFRRLDEETLQALVSLPELRLTVIYTWCEGDQEGGADGWRISELRPLRDPSKDKSRPWYWTVSEADEKYKSDAGHVAQQTQNTQPLDTHNNQTEEEENDDDDYWAQYDQAASQTPAQRLTPALPAPTQANGQAGNTEARYYSQYDSVQPAMDADDPSEDQGAIGESSLNGNSVFEAISAISNRDTAPVDPILTVNNDDHIIHTRPSSSSSSLAVAQLEQTAEHQSQAEIAIQQHVGTTMKSLYRLTRAAGIDSAEFRRLVQNELELLSLMDD
jgi:hypothetical protein